MSILSATRRPMAQQSARPGVPWLTVATLALGLSCTTAFWFVSLEGTIGSPERFETPFATSLMVAVTLLPFFGAGVLGDPDAGQALVRSRAALPRQGGRHRGPVRRRPAPCSVIAALVASAVYDYHLQVPFIGRMAGMAPCTGSCVPREQHEILALHVRGVWLVGRWLLLTNAVLVTWLVAMWGGRIKLTTSPSGDAAEAPARAGGLRHDVRLLLGGMLVGAAVIHAAVVPEHLDEWLAAGVFFIALTTAELAVAGLLLTGHGGRRILLAAAAVSVIPLTAWLWSRTLGLPFGPEPGVTEAVGVPDVLACVLEVGALLAAIALLRPGRARAAPALGARPEPGGAGPGRRHRDRVHRHRAELVRRLRRRSQPDHVRDVAMRDDEQLAHQFTQESRPAGPLGGNRS